MPSPFVPLLLDYATETTLALVRTAVDAINAKLPAALGRTAAAGSLSTALSTEDAAKVPALGQALAAGSVPVVLPAAQAAGPLALQAQLPAALGITTAAGSMSVAPASDALFDVKDRAARLLGALTGVNGSGVATGANPVPIQLSSGSTLYTGATAALSLPIVFARSLSAVSATLAINGEVIKASAGSALWITMTNTTGSSVYWQIHDLASGPPSAGARAAASAPAITANNGSRTGDLIGPTLGLGCNTGILLVLSLSPTVYSAVASNSCSYSIQYL